MNWSIPTNAPLKSLIITLKTRLKFLGGENDIANSVTSEVRECVWLVCPNFFSQQHGDQHEAESDIWIGCPVGDSP
jgi:hypothetical protein